MKVQNMQVGTFQLVGMNYCDARWMAQHSRVETRRRTGMPHGMLPQNTANCMSDAVSVVFLQLGGGR